MKSFKHHLVEFDNPQIYCDMDGVVADFYTFTYQWIGTKFSDKYYPDIPVDTFARLPKMRDADVLWGYIKQFQPIMLTAAPRPARGAIAKRAPEDKIRWMKKNFRVPRSRMRVVLRPDKKKFAKDGRDGRPNILIDDHAVNIKEWETAGGIGIVHTDAASTINDLKKIGFP